MTKFIIQTEAQPGSPAHLYVRDSVNHPTTKDFSLARRFNSKGEAIDFLDRCGISWGWEVVPTLDDSLGRELSSYFS